MYDPCDVFSCLLFYFEFTSRTDKAEKEKAEKSLETAKTEAVLPNHMMFLLDGYDVVAFWVAHDRYMIGNLQAEEKDRLHAEAINAIQALTPIPSESFRIHLIAKVRQDIQETMFVTALATFFHNLPSSSFG